MAVKMITDALLEFDERYYRHRHSANALQNFGTLLDKYIKDVSAAYHAAESEEHTKKILNTFLESIFYGESPFQVNTSSNIDSVIKYEGKLFALIETKRTGNKTEMVSESNFNRKALWEIVFYYLSETRDTLGKRVLRKRDIEIRRLIITDALKWFLIDAPDLESLCDGYLENHFFKYKNSQLTYTNDNAKFYEDIRMYFEKIDITQKLPVVFFDLASINHSWQTVRNLYKIFSSEYLLKFGFKQESTTHVLNDRFYQELLYIIGLKETAEKNKTVIIIDPTTPNSLAGQVFKKYIVDKDCPVDIAIDKTFELIIIWLNRLLFIKLFEGQLIAFNGDKPCYHILDNQKIKDFQNMQNLFFDVLGQKTRSDEVFLNQFKAVPYLNSSLFERQKIEAQDININEIKNLYITKKRHSVLGKMAPSKIAVLEYIIDFLNSYSFDAIPDDEDDNHDNKDIIDAAVLGLIFEKLNAYKDGSHYTPSSITEYMCKEAIESIALRKINSELSWSCRELWEIKEKAAISIKTAQQVNNAINSIRICDPSVGSGHFLVSALNRLIAIKKYLGVLFKFGTQERMVECNIVVIDDILCIFDGQGELFKYDKLSYQSQQIQETLFNEKRLLIEDCLFGVDSNPKAVSICNLRLWVELLKNAYYKNGVMETLPNIDINIKCGNSLISRMKYETGKKIGVKNSDLDKLSQGLIREYKRQVKRYKSIADKKEKQDVVRAIEELKSTLEHTYSQTSLFEPKKMVDLYEHAFEWAFEFPEVLSEGGVFLGFDGILGNPPYLQLQGMGKESDKLNEMKYESYCKMGDIYCLFYELGFHLLGKDGLLSFITSNKWMRAGYGSMLRGFLATHTNPIAVIDFAGHKIFDSATVDVNILTFEKGVNLGETKSCIIKDDCLTNLSVYVEQNHSRNCFCSSDSWCILNSIERIIREKINSIGTPLRDWNIQINYGIKTGLNEAFIIDSATRDALVAADPKSAEIIRPILRGRDIKRYQHKYADLYIIATFPSRHYDINDYPSVKEYLQDFGIERLEQSGKTHIINGTEVKSRKKTRNQWFETQDSIGYWDDFSKQKIAWGNLCLHGQYTLVTEACYVNNPANIIVPGDKYILAVLNSSIADFYIRGLGVTRNGGYFEYKPMFVEKLPIPQLSDTEKKPIISLVDAILEKRKKQLSTEDLEAELNRRIYITYGLSPEEITYLHYCNSLQ